MSPEDKARFIELLTAILHNIETGRFELANSATVEQEVNQYSSPNWGTVAPEPLQYHMTIEFYYKPVGGKSYHDRTD